MSLIEAMRTEMSELPVLSPRAAARVAVEMWIRDGRDPTLLDSYKSIGSAAFGQVRLMRDKVGQPA